MFSYEVSLGKNGWKVGVGRGFVLREKKKWVGTSPAAMRGFCMLKRHDGSAEDADFALPAAKFF